jgi:hypothetical protein
MGREATCTARLDGHSSRGHARLEEKDLYFRGDFRVKVPFADVRQVDARGGTLVLDFSGGSLALDLGRDADRWAQAIRQPRPLLDKLGVKPGARVSVVGVEAAGFVDELLARGADVSEGRTRKDSDLVFVAMRDRRGLDRLASLRQAIKPTGAIWVLWPKGRKELREDDVRGRAVAEGLVDVKVVSFSAELSGLKLVIPVSRR